jgi:uncharacterized protein (TIGR02118 family)
VIKSFALLPRRKDLTNQQFRDHWLIKHAPLAQELKTLQRYIQSHVHEENLPGFPHSTYDGIVEIWFEDLPTALNFPNDPAYINGLKQDEPNFLDVNNMGILFTREHILQPCNPGGVKLLFLVKRKPGMDVTVFHDYWLHQHAVLVEKTPHLIGYCQCHTVNEMYDIGEPLFDGVAQLWWPDQQSFHEAWQSDEIRVEQAEGLVKFIDMNNTLGMVVKEKEIINVSTPG